MDHSPTDYRPIDMDNHYYEPIDAFTRHLDPAFAHRGVRAIKDGKRTQILVGGKLSRFIPNPTFDPIIVPGCIDPIFRGEVPEGVDPRSLFQVEPLRPEYQDRDLRAKLLEVQNLESVVMFPTLACGVEEQLRADIPATMASITAFNKWLHDDWGYDYKGIISAPILALADPELAAEELDRVLGLGARIVCVRPAPVPAPNAASRSLGDPIFDPIWARLAEAGVPVAFHLSDSGYENRFSTAWGGGGDFGFGVSDPLSRVIVADRAIHDTMASLVVHGVFTRHPTLRAASIENGSDWMHTLAKRLKKASNQAPWSFAEDPVQQLFDHVWVAPYCEEDFHRLVDLVGTERVLFGSDWPHGEGLTEPTNFFDELEGFDEPAVRRIMRENALELLGA